MRPALAGIVLMLAACSAPPKQTHSLAALGPAPTYALPQTCPLWLRAVEDRRSAAQRESWHTGQRLELEEVAEGVQRIAQGIGLAAEGGADAALDIEILNAYLDTVAGMRSFHLVLRVRQADGDSWIARGRAVNVPWTSSAASVKATLREALQDSQRTLLEGLQGRCGAIAAS